MQLHIHMKSKQVWIKIHWKKNNRNNFMKLIDICLPIFYSQPPSSTTPTIIKPDNIALISSVIVSILANQVMHSHPIQTAPNSLENLSLQLQHQSQQTRRR